MQNKYLTFPIYLKLFLGRFIIKFGLVFFIFSLFMLKFLDAQDTIIELQQFNGELQTAKGVVTGWAETNSSINDEDVYQIFYSFSYNDVPYESSSYKTGDIIESGTEVTVEFAAEEPYYSRIQGLRYSKMGIMMLFIALFPVIGLSIVVYFLNKSFLDISLIKHGKIADAKIESIIERNKKREDRNYLLTLSFLTETNETQTVKYKSTSETIEDKRVIYNPTNINKHDFLNDIALEISNEGYDITDIKIKGNIYIEILLLVLTACSIIYFLS